MTANDCYALILTEGGWIVWFCNIFFLFKVIYQRYQQVINHYGSMLTVECSLIEMCRSRKSFVFFLSWWVVNLITKTWSRKNDILIILIRNWSLMQTNYLSNVLKINCGNQREKKHNIFRIGWELPIHGIINIEL